MAIKSDKWIRKMAEQKDMISPFEPKMVRDLDGKKIMAMIFDVHLNLEYSQISIAR